MKRNKMKGEQIKRDKTKWSERGQNEMKENKVGWKKTKWIGINMIERSLHDLLIRFIILNLWFLLRGLDILLQDLYFIWYKYIAETYDLLPCG